MCFSTLALLLFFSVHSCTLSVLATLSSVGLTKMMVECADVEGTLGTHREDSPI